MTLRLFVNKHNHKYSCTAAMLDSDVMKISPRDSEAGPIKRRPILRPSLVSMTPYLSCLLVLAATCGTLHCLPVGDQGSAWERSGKFEGDIVFKDGVSAKNGLLNSVYYWPNRTLVYKMAPNDFTAAQKTAITAAFNDYAAKTCIRMREARSWEKDYVYIQGSDSGCYSHVGKIGGAQTLNLANGCFTHGTILHELLHALGFYHQQSATDRDTYVSIIWANIEAGYENAFDKYPSNVITDFGVGYDYGSVMHYGATAFSSNGGRTIIPTDLTATIGQRNGFSPSDIAKLQKMYGCSK